MNSEESPPRPRIKSKKKRGGQPRHPGAQPKFYELSVGLALADGFPKPFTRSLSGGIFDTFEIAINDHHQNVNHSQFFEPETNLNLLHSPGFFATVQRGGHRTLRGFIAQRPVNRRVRNLMH
jgi:hypothetical protein